MMTIYLNNTQKITICYQKYTFDMNKTEHCSADQAWHQQLLSPTSLEPRVARSLYQKCAKRVILTTLFR
jgi:hypothetical protein